MGRSSKLVTALGAGALVVVVTFPVIAGEPTRVTRMPGERVLTESEQTKAIATASAHERARLQVMFSNPSIQPVAYTRVNLRLIKDAAGKVQVLPVDVDASAAGSQLRLPKVPKVGINGTGGRYDLYISIGVGRLSGGGYRWVIANYAHWNGSNGIDACNRAEDSLATAWSDHFTMYDDSYHGKYQPYGSRVDDVDIYRSDATPKVGVAWSFHELKQRNSQVCTNMKWADGNAWISESTWKSDTANAVLKYFHTKGSGHYSLGFSLPGGGPSISISPADSNQWSAAAFASFTH